MRTSISIFLLLLIFMSALVAQSTKRGGIYFRIDDNQPIQKWRDYAKVMNKHGMKFGFAINLGLIGDNKEYFQLIKNLQASGHELQDHTPNHHTMYFTYPNSRMFASHPGVDHITDDKVCLRLSPLNIGIDYAGEGNAEISGNIVISKNPGAFKLFRDRTIYSRIYFPDINTICGFSTVKAFNEEDVDTLYVTSNWDESIVLPNRETIRFEILTSYEIDIVDEGLQLLGERTLELCAANNLSRPYVWIQPGGLHSVIKRSQAKRVFGDKLGYTSAGIAQDPVVKGYNISNGSGDAEFGMNWGDFLDYRTYFSRVKTTIADRVAKHHVLGGSNHFIDLLGTWEEYLVRLDSLVEWCKLNNIAVKTQNEWAQTLYGNTVNAYENIIPPLYVDLDKNKRPDGYFFQPGYTTGELDSNDGVAADNGFSFSSSKTGVVTEITDLTGIEKGDLDFRIWIKGITGNNVWVKFTFPEINQSITFSFPTENSVWKQFSLDQSNNGNTQLTVPESVSLVNIAVICPAIKNPPIKISGMELRKKLTYPLKIVSFPVNKVGVGKYYEYKINVFSQDRDEPVNVSTISAPPWLSINKQNILSGIAPNEIIKYPISLVARNRFGDADTQNFILSAKPLSRFSFNTKIVNFGRILWQVPKDTTILLANIGEDSIIVSQLHLTSSNIKFSAPSIILPNEVKEVNITYVPENAGSIQEKIIIHTKQGIVAADTLLLEGFIDSINQYGGIAGYPAEFSLSQNYPNPFNAGTVLKYAVITECNITVRIFNVLGQTIKTFEAAGRKPSGFYQIHWNGDNDFGTSTGSGVYFLTLIAEPLDGSPVFQSTRKLVYIR